MNLDIQIQCLITSFFYGFLFSYLVNFNYNRLFNSNMIFRCFFNSIIFIGGSILYFYIMYLINYANIHIYFILLIFIGFYCGNKFSYKVRR